MTSPSLPKLCLIGPLPPPSGGMANQCEQLLRLLRAEGLSVELVRTNAPYRPAWVAGVPVVRALARLLPYVAAVWQVLGRVQVVHLLANSGWAFHLFASPVLLLARWRGVPVIVNYRGGLAGEFLAGAPGYVHGLLRGAAACVAPSRFLQRVLAKYGLPVEVIPNILDLTRFSVCPLRQPGQAPHLLVARNLELIYDIPTVLRAFALVRQRHALATLTVAGTGPELHRLQSLVQDLGLADAVNFAGRIDNAKMPQEYARADLALNASRVDNMPISLLEAFASGVPVVSTAAGGIPDMLRDGVTGLLVPVGDHVALAQAALRLLADHELAQSLANAAATEARDYAWPQVKLRWFDMYRRVAAPGVG